MSITFRVAVVLIAVDGFIMTAPGCNPKSGTEGIVQGDAPASALTLRSPVFSNYAAIPSKYTCEGQDVSPPLGWSGVPAGTKSLVLIVDDPDAPDPAAPKITWVHWVLYDLPVSTTELAEAARQLPPGTREGVNGWKKIGYGGPCPPIGRHRYFFKLYALDTELGDLGTPNKDKIVAAMKGHVLGQTALTGTYQKANR